MTEARIRALAVSLLLCTTLFGLNAMFGQLYRNGWLDEMTRALSSSDPKVAVLPGSKKPILKRFTGWEGLDWLLALSNFMFANVTDGTRPQLSLYAIQFGGQLAPAFALITIEGLRVGNKYNSFYYSVLWAYLWQMLGYAIAGPLYLILHLLTSPAATNDKQAIRPRYLAALDLKVVIPAFGIGYVALTCLWAYPFASSTAHQWFCALWQGFPQYVVGLQYLLAKLKTPSAKDDARPETRPLSRDFDALSAVYDFTFNAAAVAQLFVFSTLIAVKIAPGLFSETLGEAFTFGNVFVPGSFWSSEPMESMGAAIHTCYLYDQYGGSVAILIWSVALYVMSRKRAMTWKNVVGLAWDVVRWSAVAGPAGAMVRLLQRRDETLLMDGGARTKSKRR